MKRFFAKRGIFFKLVLVGIILIIIFVYLIKQPPKDDTYYLKLAKKKKQVLICNKVKDAEKIIECCQNIAYSECNSEDCFQKIAVQLDYLSNCKRVFKGNWEKYCGNIIFELPPTIEAGITFVEIRDMFKYSNFSAQMGMIIKESFEGSSAQTTSLQKNLIEKYKSEIWEGKCRGRIIRWLGVVDDVKEDFLSGIRLVIKKEDVVINLFLNSPDVNGVAKLNKNSEVMFEGVLSDYAGFTADISVKQGKIVYPERKFVPLKFKGIIAIGPYSELTQCNRNLSELKDSLKKWSVAKGKRAFDVVDANELLLYIKKFPSCPSGGNYVFMKVKDLPRCSFHNKREIKNDKQVMNERVNVCQKNLLDISIALEKFASDNNMNETNSVTMNDLVPGYLNSIPICPLEGAYAFITIDDIPSCSAHGKFKDIELIKRELMQKRYLKAVLKFFDKGNEKEALDFYRKAKAIYATLPQSMYSYIGGIYYDTGKYNQGISAYKKALDSDKNNLSSYYGIAEIFEKMKEYESSIEFLEISLTIQDNERIYRKVAQLYVELKQYEKAISIYEKLLRLLTNNVERFEIVEKIGDIYISLNKYDDVLAVYKNAIQAFSSDYYKSRAYDKTASILIFLKKYDDAIAIYNDAMKLDPDNYRTKIVELYSSLKKYNEIIVILRQELKHSDFFKARLLHNQIGDYYFILGEYAKARDEYIEAVYLNRNNPEFNFDVGRVSVEMKYFEDGIYWLKLVESAGGNSAYLYYYLGRAYAGSREFENAENAFNKALRLCNDQEFKMLIQKAFDEEKLSKQ